jgi:hypothetical protein
MSDMIAFTAGFAFSSDIIAFILGCVSSLLIWLLITCCITPKITICKEIAESTQNDGKTLYKMKIINDTCRNAYDIMITFRIYYSGTYFSISCPGVPVLFGKNRHPTYERLIPVDLYGIKESKIYGIPNDVIKNKYENKKLTIDDFFDNNPKEDTHLEFVLTAYDGFSNTRRCKVVKYYRENIKKGVFKQGEKFVDTKSETSTE